MNLFDIIKDVANVVQKAGSIDLSRQLLDAMQLALEMQEELRRLKEENANLKKKNDLRPFVERHNDPFITLKNDAQELRYCSHCWDAEEKLIQLHCNEKAGRFECPHCKVDGIFDFQKCEATMHSSYAGGGSRLFE